MTAPTAAESLVLAVRMLWDVRAALAEAERDEETWPIWWENHIKPLEERVVAFLASQDATEESDG